MGEAGSYISPRLSPQQGAPTVWPGLLQGGARLQATSTLRGLSTKYKSHSALCLNLVPEGVKNSQVTPPAGDTGCHPELQGRSPR